MAVQKALRNLTMLGVAPAEFLVQADDTEEAVRAGLAKLLPKVRYELEPISEKQAASLRGRLSQPQLDFLNKVRSEVDVKVGSRAQSYRLRLPEEPKLAAAANKKGIVQFDPQISAVRKPLGGGIGPVGVTVGIGIAGKF
jgi:hypothetical protein